MKMRVNHTRTLVNAIDTCMNGHGSNMIMHTQNTYVFKHMKNCRGSVLPGFI